MGKQNGFGGTARQRRLPPGPKGSRLLGNLAHVQRDALGFLRASHATYGDILYYRIAFWPIYRLDHPDYAQHVLQDNHRNYGKGSIDYKMLRRVSGNGLIANEGESWLQQRRLMQPLFHRRRIERLGPVITAATARMLGRWAELGTGAALDVNGAMAGLTLDIVSRALFSLEIGERGEQFSRAFGEVNAYLGSFDPLFAFGDWWPTRGMGRYRRALRTLDEIVYGIIAARRQEPEAGEDMLDLLLAARDAETGAGMDDRQIRDEVMTLLIAGHETTANALSWTWYLLGQHREVRERLEDELERVLGGRLPTMADYPKLMYTQQVLAEALRLYPPAWFISRTAIEADEIDGYAIPPQAFISVSTYMIHRHPAFWPKPEAFDPERFAPDAAAARPRFAYLPFGAGPRQCIGNHFALTEATLILATVAQRYRLVPVAGKPVVPQAFITLHPRDGVWMRLETRG